MKILSVLTGLLIISVTIKAQTIEDVREYRDGSQLEVKISNGSSSTISMSGFGSKYLGGWCGKAVVVVHERAKNDTQVYVYMWNKANNALNKMYDFSLCNNCVVKAVTQSGIVAKRPDGDNQHYDFNGNRK